MKELTCVCICNVSAWLPVFYMVRSWYQKRKENTIGTLFLGFYVRPFLHVMQIWITKYGFVFWVVYFSYHGLVSGYFNKVSWLDKSVNICMTWFKNAVLQHPCVCVCVYEQSAGYYYAVHTSIFTYNMIN